MLLVQQAWLASPPAADYKGLLSKEASCHCLLLPGLLLAWDLALHANGRQSSKQHDLQEKLDGQHQRFFVSEPAASESICAITGRKMSKRQG